MPVLVVFSTFPDPDKAADVARTLVSEQLAACVNLVGPVRSIYRWNGEISDDKETLAVIKTMPEGAARTQELALVYHALGRKTEADAALKDLVETSSDAFLIAEVCAFRGEVDAAFEWLRRDDLKNAIERPFQTPHWIKRRSPFLKALHADARWSDWAAPRP